jgi:Flp pilus assembly protein TadB
MIVGMSVRMIVEIFVYMLVGMTVFVGMLVGMTVFVCMIVLVCMLVEMLMLMQMNRRNIITNEFPNGTTEGYIELCSVDLASGDRADADLNLTWLQPKQTKRLFDHR